MGQRKNRILRAALVRYVYLHAMPQLKDGPTFEYRGETYCISTAQQHPRFADHAVDVILREMKHRKPDLSHPDVLLVGCGPRGLTIRFKKQGAQVTGIDIVPAFVEAVKGQGIEAHEMDDEHHTFPQERKFDTVVYSDSIGHMDYRQTLKEADRVLRPQGVVSVLTPHRSQGKQKTRSLLGVTPTSSPHDRDHPSPKTSFVGREGPII